MAPRFDKLLILDVDETLVHATYSPLPRAADLLIEDIHVYKRPGLDAFLKTCFEWFEVAVWTASSADYVEPLMRSLLPDPSRLAFLWSRARCTIRTDPETFEQDRLKKLNKVKRRGYSLERVLVVDDSARKHVRNYGNLIQIREFEGDPEDRELAALIKFLEWLGPAENVRRIEKRAWRQRFEP